MVRLIVERMGGALTLESTPGEGAAFRVELPLTMAAGLTVVSSSPDPYAALREGPVRVLIVEDQRVNALVARTLMQKLGCATQHAANGRAALEAVERDTFDLILMDCQMPELDGYEAARQIRAREFGSGRHVIIVALTAHALHGDRKRCLDAGMDGYVAKPLVVDTLLAEVGRVAPSSSTTSTRPAAGPHARPHDPEAGCARGHPCDAGSSSRPRSCRAARRRIRAFPRRASRHISTPTSRARSTVPRPRTPSTPPSARCTSSPTRAPPAWRDPTLARR